MGAPHLDRLGRNRSGRAGLRPLVCGLPRSACRRLAHGTDQPGDAQRALAQAYLEHLYAPEAQALAFKHFYRAWDTSAAAPEDVARFPKLDLVGIEDFGGWSKAQPEHFGDGGIFDQIYVPQ